MTGEFFLEGTLLSVRIELHILMKLSFETNYRNQSACALPVRYLSQLHWLLALKKQFNKSIYTIQYNCNVIYHSPPYTVQKCILKVGNH